MSQLGFSLFVLGAGSMLVGVAGTILHKVSSFYVALFLFGVLVMMGAVFS